MTHEEVKKSGAVAKYLQGALPEKEREEFEEHLFDCPECSGIIKADSMLKVCGELARGKEAPEEDDEEEISGPALGTALKWVSLHPRVAAGALLVAVLTVPLTGYQNWYLIPWLQAENKSLQEENERLSSPRALSFRFVGGQARSGSDVGAQAGKIVKLPQGCAEVVLEFEIDPEGWADDYSQFQGFIEGKSGSFEILNTALDGGFMLHLLVPCPLLPLGDYELKLYGLAGGSRALIETYRFETQRE